MKIQVLMSSYNGERYIEDQIRSLLNQKDVEVSLLIRDDGSTDSTTEILKRLMAEDNRIECFFEDNIGVKKSFLKLVKNASPDADYYALSDQDDIWLEDKLIVAVNRLNQEDNNIPLIYGSSVSLYSGEKIIGKQFECPSRLFLGNFLIKNYYPGCTMVFNRKLKELISIVDYNDLNVNPLHDHWLNLVCTACGGSVFIDNEPHILYRQHEGNVIGDRNLIQKIKGNGLFSSIRNVRYNICKELHFLYESYEDDISKIVINTVLSYKSSIKTRIKLAFSKDIRPISFVERISKFLMVITGKF